MHIASASLKLHCAVEGLVLGSEALCQLAKAMNNRVRLRRCTLHHLLHRRRNGLHNARKGTQVLPRIT